VVPQVSQRCDGGLARAQPGRDQPRSPWGVRLEQSAQVSGDPSSGGEVGRLMTIAPGDLPLAVFV